jgi:hypothetical protein
MSPRLMLILAAAATLLTAVAGLYWKGRHDGVAHERPKTQAALAQAAVAGLETAGAKQSARQTAFAVARRDAATDATAKLTTEALTSEDARALLDPARADRLRADDHELCLTAPELVGCPAH